MRNLIWLTAFIPILGICAPDEDALGKSRGYPVSVDRKTFRQRDDFLVGGLSHADKVYKSEMVKRGSEISSLIRSDAQVNIRYTYQGEKSLQDYLDRNRSTGLMIIKDGKVLVERYQYDRKPDMRFFSASVAKSVISLLVGIALDEGKIKSLDDSAIKYAPDLKGTAYANVTIRNLLRMLSGAKYNHDVDTAKLNQRTWFGYGNGGAKALDFVEDTLHPQGTVFHYSGADSFVLGVVLKAAIGGGSVSEYMSEKLWKPMGAESDASWILDSTDTPIANCCFNAVLRDYARLGMLLANDGNFNGKQIISKEYLLEATSIDLQPDVNKPRVNGKGVGYGYQFWLLPIKTRTFAMYGHYGQSVLVQPATKTVVVITSAWAENATAIRQATAERSGFNLGVLRSLAADAQVYQ